MIAYLRGGSMPDEAAALQQAQAASVRDQGIVASSMISGELAAIYDMRAVAEHGRVMLPLSVARVLLSMLLVAASAMVLAARPGSRSFALQVIAANAAFALIAYTLTIEMREQWIAAVVRGTSELSLPDEHQMLRSPSYWLWLTRFRLVVFELGLLGLAALAMNAKRTRAFLEASARASDRREREDEP